MRDWRGSVWIAVVLVLPAACGSRAPTCVERAASFRSEIAAAVAAADHACATNDDCVNIADRIKCQGSVCPVHYLSKTGAAAVQSLLETIEARDCEPYFKAGCVAPTERCPDPGYPACESGRCIATHGIEPRALQGGGAVGTP